MRTSEATNLVRAAWRAAYRGTGLRLMLARMALGALVMMGVWLLGSLVWYSLAPRAAFFSYHGVEHVDTYLDVDSGLLTLVLESDRTILRGDVYSFMDDLECVGSGDAVPATVARLHSVVPVRAAVRFSVRWAWPVDPAALSRMGVRLPAVCTAESLITLGLPFGQKRVQVVASESFTVP